MLALWARVLDGWKSDLIRVRSSTLIESLRQIRPQRDSRPTLLNKIIGEQLGQLNDVSCFY